MLDIAILRANSELVKKGCVKKLVDPSLVDEALALDGERRRLLREVETKQARLNTVSDEIAQSHGQQKIDRINEAGPLSLALKKLRPELEKAESEYRAVMLAIPNLPDDDVPDGSSDADNRELRREGEPPQFDFAPRGHAEILESLNMVNFSQAAKLSGHKFYYLLGDAVVLELSLLRYALDKLHKKGFIPVSPPDLVKREAMVGVAHFPPEDDAYKLPEDKLFLAGTAEVGLVNLHASQSLPVESLPRRYAGYSVCFRREAGAHGQKGSGLYRVHQFHKIEMVSFVAPDDSPAEHELLLSIAEEILQELGLHYRLVLNCGGDLGMPQAKKYDLECFIPSEERFGETHSASNDTDYQARRLNIKFKTSAGGRTQKAKAAGFVHTLNNTAVASPRLLIPLIEQHQQKDGSVLIPEVLRPYTGFDRLAAT